MLSGHAPSACGTDLSRRAWTCHERSDRRIAPRPTLRSLLSPLTLRLLLPHLLLSVCCCSSSAVVHFSFPCNPSPPSVHFVAVGGVAPSSVPTFASPLSSQLQYMSAVNLGQGMAAQNGGLHMPPQPQYTPQLTIPMAWRTHPESLLLCSHGVVRCSPAPLLPPQRTVLKSR